MPLWKWEEIQEVSWGIKISTCQKVLKAVEFACLILFERLLNLSNLWLRMQNRLSA